MRLTVLVKALEADTNDGREGCESQHKGTGNAHGREPNIVACFFLPELRKVHTAEKVVVSSGLWIIDGNAESSEALILVFVLITHIQELAAQPHVEG